MPESERSHHLSGERFRELDPAHVATFAPAVRPSTSALRGDESCQERRVRQNAFGSVVVPDVKP